MGSIEDVTMCTYYEVRSGTGTEEMKLCCFVGPGLVVVASGVMLTAVVAK